MEPAFRDGPLCLRERPRERYYGANRNRIYCCNDLLHLFYRPRLYQDLRPRPNLRSSAGTGDAWRLGSSGRYPGAASSWTAVLAALETTKLNPMNLDALLNLAEQQATWS